MGILGFGKVQKLEDLKVDDLKKERLTQQVKQDQLLTRLRQAQDQFDALLEAASEPGLNDAEIDAAAYKMESVSKIKTRLEKITSSDTDNRLTYEQGLTISSDSISDVDLLFSNNKTYALMSKELPIQFLQTSANTRERKKCIQEISFESMNNSPEW